jgi:hypothetical protein
MVLDPTSGAIQSNLNVDRQISGTVAEKASDGEEKRPPEAGQTSESSPAVVTNISAAALETARAVNGSDQTADQTNTENVVDKDNTGQSQALREQEVSQKRQDIAKGRIDIMV